MQILDWVARDLSKILLSIMAAKLMQFNLVPSDAESKEVTLKAAQIFDRIDVVVWILVWPQVL